jgi:hypothetical protein
MLSSKGFSDVRVVVAYRAFSSFLLGHLLHEVSLLSVQTSPAEKPPEEAEAEAMQAEVDNYVARFTTGLLRHRQAPPAGLRQQRWRQKLAAACAAHAGLGPTSLVLFDVSVRHEALVVRVEVRDLCRGCGRSCGRGAGGSPPRWRS